MTNAALVDEYLAALAAGDAARAIAMFTPGGVVHSPLYGDVPAAEFYPRLFADTAGASLTLRSVMKGTRDGAKVVSFWFDFDWVLANGETAPFTVVDVAELDPEGRIRELHIVYDTFPIRAAFDRLN